MRQRLLDWAHFGRWRYTNAQATTWITHVKAYVAACVIVLFGVRGDA